MTSARRFFSILFLFLMGLNTIGYYSFLFIIKGQLTRQVITRIQSGINAPGGDMIIKIPLSVPYQGNSENYEPISGEISYDQSVYQLVKQRVYKDTLYVVCIRDQKSTEANNSIKEYSRSLSGQSGQEGTGIKLVSSVAKYYVVENDMVVVINSGWTRDGLFKHPGNAYSFNPGRSIFHPPQSVA